jgi:hypothetical protein
VRWPPSSTAPTSTTPPAGQSVITLSPFKVSTTQDSGYVGQDRLAGSRLRTNIKDIAAAISPMTAEFLSDIAATSIENEIEYGVGNRIETDDARAAGPVADGYNDGFRSIRIRGLAGGGRSINFFNAPGGVDLYITERLEVSRGREQSWRSAGHNDQNRAFLAAKWQIDRRTTLKVEHEHGEINRFVPRPFFASDYTSIWNASGQPIFDDFAANHVPGTPGTSVVGTQGTPFRDTGATSVTGVRERSGGDWVVVSDRFPFAQNFRQFTYSEAAVGGVLANDFDMGRRNPDAVLEANGVRGAFRVKNASAPLQRELARDLNLEFGFNRQVSSGDTHNLATWNHYGIAADTNR